MSGSVRRRRQRTATIHVVQRARQIFALDRDPSAANERLSADPVLAPSVAARLGLRVPGTWDAYEIGVRSRSDRNESRSRFVARSDQLSGGGRFIIVAARS